MRTRFGLTAGLALVVALVASLGASAAFPGNNGKIVFGSLYGGEDEIWVMDADGTDRQNLTRHDGAKISDIDPRWSPDGRRIVYASDPTGSMQIWIMNANGSEPRALTNLPGRNRYPAFTAHGNQIVFQSLVGGNFEIYRMDADGSDVTNLTNSPGVEWAPATSPRGKKIVFTRELGASGHLYIWSPDEPLKQVTSGPGYDYFANWSPSGNDLVFIRNVSGEDEIYTAHADGTGERLLPNTAGDFKWFPAFSPDGKKILYTACTAPRPPSAPNPVCSTHMINRDGTSDVDLAFPTPQVSFPFSDDFDDNSRDIAMWNYLHDGVGGSIQETNSRVEISIAEDARPSPGQLNIGAHTGFKCLIGGDFDAEVDFELLEWPAANGVRVHLMAFYGQASVGRQSETWGEQYSASVDPSFWNGVETDDVTGSLRLVRTGSTYAGYYKHEGSWIPLLEAPGGTGEVIVALVASSYGNFGQERVRVAFDNFRLDASRVDCSPFHTDLHADWQAVK